MSGVVTFLNREVGLRNQMVLVWFCAVALPLLAQAPPNRDTFVSAAKSTTNYGSNASLVVQVGGGAHRRRSC